MGEATCRPKAQATGPRLPPTPLLQPRQNAQGWDPERNQRVSKLHGIMSLFSYLLLLSDVPRTGFGVYTLSFYKLIEPDQFIFFGPYAYPVTKQLLKNTTTTGSIRFWPYKYDSTSVAMRAVATHLPIPQWPACVTYDATCDELPGLPRATVFSMIDSLIEGVKTHEDDHEPNGKTGRLTLRTQSEWSDRLHNYAFPWFFSTPRVRTIQATYFNLAQLAAQPTVSLCGSVLRGRRPLTCGESLINFGRLCTNKFCQGVGNIHSHVPTRLDTLLQMYPNHTMDFVLLEAVDDLSRSSLSSQGYKNVDIVTLARIRKCTTPEQCETILVDDFRYEVVSLVANVREWFWVTAILRGIGQFYAWMRLTFLVVGCYLARANEPSVQQSSYFRRAMTTVRTLTLLRSQIMVYGSLIPVSCYAVAHLIDAAIVYDLVAVQFTTVMGIISLEFWELLRVCAVSMRSLWVLAIVSHVMHRIAIHCAWSPVHGVPGVPEFSLSFVASLTILAQVRYPSLRNSRVLSVEELVPSATRYLSSSMQSDSNSGLMYKLLFGTLMDYKCLTVAVCVHLVLLLAVRLVHRVIPRCFKYQSVLFTRTIVPYSAGSLWPRSALVVSWNGTYLAKPLLSQAATRPDEFLTLRPTVGIKSPLHHVTITPIQPPPHVVKSTSEQFTTSIHRHLASSPDSEALIFFMNLAVMTDPLTLLQLRVFRGTRVGVYTIVSKPCSRHWIAPAGSSSSASSTTATATLVLPLALVTSPSDIPIDWSKLELQRVVHTSKLDWCDLLRCG